MLPVFDLALPAAACAVVIALLSVVMLGPRPSSTGLATRGCMLCRYSPEDAIVLSLTPKAGGDLAQTMVVLCVTLAAATNTAMKGIYCRVIAEPELGWKVLGPNLLSAILVLAAALGASALNI